MSSQTNNLKYDLICFSHLRWDFVTQRPQHLLRRCARERRVFFVEEPIFDGGNGAAAKLNISKRADGVTVVVPHFAADLPIAVWDTEQKRLLVPFFADEGVTQYILWFYTPMAISLADVFEPQAIVYDCMDELSAFKGASTLMKTREAELLRRTDLVFTGGQSLYEAKAKQHARAYAFPSSVDTAHFAAARAPQSDTADQAGIPHPRLGFYGVIDERFDVPLLAGIAALRPDWHWIILGPVVKIDAATLPQGSNIHYLGGKSYDELPAYIAGWDVALLLFARNDSTRFISPTKTPEYLAAGKPVVSTSIRDVIRPYGDQNLVRIADTPEEFVAACEAAMAEDAAERLSRADPFLAQMSWDHTWAQMAALIAQAVAANTVNVK